ncbi:MAG: response regulator, partial [Bacteroidota bacterium]
EIVLESKVGKGSVFHLKLDLPVSSSRQTLMSKKEGGNKYNLMGLRVLMVEDNHFNRLIGERFLQKWGALVDHANNGQDGLKRLYLKQYDLVLMDLEMPVMNGYDAIRAIRDHEDAAINDISIVALTATVTNKIKSDVLKLGVNDVVSKPFDPEYLYSVVLENSPDWIRPAITA